MLGRPEVEEAVVVVEAILWYASNAVAIIIRFLLLVSTKIYSHFSFFIRLVEMDR
jgi:hypothetical protein